MHEQAEAAAVQAGADMAPGLTTPQMPPKGALQPDLACSGCAALAVMPPLSAYPCSALAQRSVPRGSRAVRGNTL